MSITVRKMIRDDIYFVANLYYEGFWDKAQPLKYMSEKEATALVEELMLSHDENLENYFVALIDDQLAGVIKLMRNDSKDKFKLPSLKYFIKFGPMNLIKTGLTLHALEWDITENQLYIELVAVAPDMRGRGVATVLLDYAEALTRCSQSLEYMTLGVIEKNTKARKLYERIGFKALKSKRSLFLKKYADVERIHFMKKRVNDSN